MAVLEKLIYNVANTKSYGHIMIDTDNWKNSTSFLQINLKGGLVTSSITNVLKINDAPAYRPTPFKEGDLVAISNLALRVAKIKNYQLPNDSTKYANIHISQVLGTFDGDTLSLDNFTPIYDKVLMRKVDIPASTSLQLVTDNMSVGEVIKVGTGGFDKEWQPRPMKIELGKHVLIRDNVTTTISLDGEEYYVVDDLNVVGEFTEHVYDMEHLTIYNDDISIFEEYIDDRIEGSFLYRPVLSDDDDIAQSYTENTFKLVKSNVLEDGIYMISRFDTEYIIFKKKTYFVVDNSKIMARKIKGEV